MVTLTEILVYFSINIYIGISDDYIQILYSANINDEELKELIQLIDDYKTTQEKEKKFYMVQNSDGYFELGNYDVKQVKLDIASHYNDDFRKFII